MEKELSANNPTTYNYLNYRSDVAEKHDRLIFHSCSLVLRSLARSNCFCFLSHSLPANIVVVVVEIVTHIPCTMYHVPCLTEYTRMRLHVSVSVSVSVSLSSSLCLSPNETRSGGKFAAYLCKFLDGP